jgi:predicted DNA-binding protein
MTTAKLTINLPEELRRQAKAIASLRGETVSEVIRSALEEYIAEAFDEAEDVRAIQMIERRIVEGKDRLYSHEEVWAEIDALEAQGPLSD